ncbi:PRKR-interacting protein 1 [Ambystoma mexicanum]|uniref:PRKR-interacting protein 1 n=1 Tax=Ambystoma mexicanum TaxID=8296 RepID=UPI0037E71DA3
MVSCARPPYLFGIMAAQSSEPKPPRPKKPPQPLVIPKNAIEEQRLKLDRLMKNPDKTVQIAERFKEWSPRAPPEFVRDVMGSSAGAGSGEFHVYRHLRRREYQRQEFMDTMTEQQKLNEEFERKLEKNRTMAEERTAKRRQKRQKLKEKIKMLKTMKVDKGKKDEDSNDSEEEPASEEEKPDAEVAEEEADQPSFVIGGR